MYFENKLRFKPCLMKWYMVTNRLKTLWPILKTSVKKWNERDPFRQSAVIAYYAIFSLPALLVIIISSAGLMFGEEAVRGEVSAQISSTMGKETAEQVEGMIAKAGETKKSIWATVIGFGVLIFGATGVFAQLQKTLDMIWGVVPKPKVAFLQMLKDRLFSFGLILSIGFLLLVSLVLSSGLALVSDWITARFPDYLLVLVMVLNFAISLGIITLLFALMFKILPDAKVRWRDVWYGSVFTALLFVIGKFALSLYFGKAEPASTYGAAGSIILILLWVSYSCMLVFLGAEFTKEYAMKYGEGIQPASYAVVDSQESCEVKAQEPQQNIPDSDQNEKGKTM